MTLQETEPRSIAGVDARAASLAAIDAASGLEMEGDLYQVIRGGAGYMLVIAASADSSGEPAAGAGRDRGQPEACRRGGTDGDSDGPQTGAPARDPRRTAPNRNPTGAATGPSSHGHRD